jgi:hypothetical protein
MNSDSTGFAPARLGTAAFASLGQCDGNGVRVVLCLKSPCDDSLYALPFRAATLHHPSKEFQVLAE